MGRFCIFLFSLILPLFGFSQKKQTQSFSNIEVRGGINVKWHKSKQHAYQVEDGDHKSEEFLIGTSGNTMTISTDRRVAIGSEINSIIHVYSPDLQSIKLVSGAMLICIDPLKTDVVDVRLNTGGQFDAEIYAKRLYYEADLGSNGELAGEVEVANVEIASGSLFEADELKALDIKIKCVSGARGDIWVTNNLDAVAKSGGKVVYRGNPRNTDKTESLGGVVEPDNY